MPNKKIKNAEKEEFNGIKFKSKIEAMVFKSLLQLGFNPEYEAHKFVLIDGFAPTVPFYKADKDGVVKNNTKKIINITYTPDISFVTKDGTTVIIEVKGFSNDTYPIKEKLFRALLEKEYPNYIFAFIKNKKQLLQLIDIIKSNYD